MPTLSSSLVKHQVASVEDVTDALARQAQYGGDLVTNLLEVSVVSEEHLVQALAEAHGLAPALAGELPSAAESIRRLLPRELAARYGFYPLEERDGVLTVAVSEPLPAEVESDLSFSLGVTIAQHVALRVRIEQALARDYGLPLEPRAERLLAKLEGKEVSSPSLAPPRDGAALERPATLAPPGFSHFSTPSSADAPSALEHAPAELSTQAVESGTESPAVAPAPAAQAGTPAVASPNPSTGVAPAPEAAPSPEPSASEVTVESASGNVEGAAPSPAVAAPAPGPAANGPAPRPSLPPVARAPVLRALVRRETQPGQRPRRLGPYTAAMAEADLLEATTRDHVLRAFFDFAAQYFEYSALFAIHGDLAEGRDAHGPGASRTKLLSIGVPLDLPSKLAEARDSLAPLLVRLGSDGIDGALAKDLERAPGRKVLLLPVRVGSRTVLILYGDHGEVDVELEAVGEVLSMAPLVSAAIERLILQRKRQLVGGALPAAVPAPRRRSLLPSPEERAQVLAAALESPVRSVLEREPVDGPAALAVEPSPTAAQPPAIASPAAAPSAEEASRSTPESPTQAPNVAPSNVAPSPLPEPAAPAPELTAQASDVAAPVSPEAAPSPSFSEAAPPTASAAPAAPAAPALEPLTLSAEPPPVTASFGSSPSKPAEASVPSAPPPIEELTFSSAPPPASPSEAAKESRSGSSSSRPSIDVESIFGASLFPPSDTDAKGAKSETKSRGRPAVPSLSTPAPSDNETPSSIAEALSRSAPSHAAPSAPPPSAPRAPASPAPEASASATHDAPPESAPLSPQSGRTPPMPTPALPAVSPDLPPAFETATPAAPPSSQRLKLVPEELANQAPDIDVGAESELSDEDIDDAWDHGLDEPAQSRAEMHSARPPAPRANTSELKLPKVIVDLTNEASALLEYLLKGDETAANQLVEMGTAAVPVLVNAFPGPLRHPSLRPGAEPTRASECGPVLKTLYRLGAKSVPFLVVRTNDADPVVRRWATHLLGELPAPESAHAVARRFFDTDETVRRAALSAAKLLLTHPEFGPQLINEFAELAEDRSKGMGMRLASIEALTDLRHPLTVPALIRLLAEGTEDVEKAAHQALVVVARQDFGRQGALWAEWWRANGQRHRIEWLIDSLTHESQDIRRAAGEELKMVTREYFGYYDDLPARERERAQSRYREWWETRGKARFH